MRQIGDNFIPVIPVDHKEHTDEHPFCSSSTCHCKEDAELISQVNEYVQQGLLTPQEATRTIEGKML